MGLLDTRSCGDLWIDYRAMEGDEADVDVGPAVTLVGMAVRQRDPDCRSRVDAGNAQAFHSLRRLLLPRLLRIK